MLALLIVMAGAWVPLGHIVAVVIAGLACLLADLFVPLNCWIRVDPKPMAYWQITVPLAILLYGYMYYKSEVCNIDPALRRLRFRINWFDRIIRSTPVVFTATAALAFFTAYWSVQLWTILS